MAKGNPQKRIKGNEYDKLAGALARQEEKKAMMDFMEDLSDEFLEREEILLKAMGIEVDFDEGWIEFRKGDDLFMVEAGPEMSVLINGKAEQPYPSFFTMTYYKNLKRRMINWAKDV